MPVLLRAKDNYTDFRGSNQKLAMCPTCLVLFDPYGHPFPGKAKPRNDLSITAEHMHLASPRLKEFLEEKSTSLLEFFETGGGYFIFRPKQEVVLDMRGFRIEATALCKTCGEPNGVFTSFEMFEAFEVAVKVLPDQRPIGPLDLVRSRQRFGERRQCNFHLIVGDQLAAEMKAQKFKGLII